MSTLLVLTNLPDRAAAEKLADQLLEKQVAACVNILAPCRSVYRWKGALQHDEEHPMLIKTTRERYPALEQALRAGHPYELPEIIAVPIERGLPFQAGVPAPDVPFQAVPGGPRLLRLRRRARQSRPVPRARRAGEEPRAGRAPGGTRPRP